MGTSMGFANGKGTQSELLLVSLMNSQKPPVVKVSIQHSMVVDSTASIYKCKTPRCRGAMCSERRYCKTAMNSNIILEIHCDCHHHSQPIEIVKQSNFRLTLRTFNISVENHHSKSGNPLFLWSCSIAMLVITRG